MRATYKLTEGSIVRLIPVAIRNGEVTIEGDQARGVQVANAINRAYSRHVVTSQAKRYGYRVTEVKPDEFEFVKA